MLAHLQGLGVGKVEDLPGGMVHGHGLVQGRAAAAAGLGEMVDGGIGGCSPAQRLAGMALLSAGVFAGLLAQTGDADGLFQPIAGWRLAAIAAVQAEPAFQFDDAGLLRQKQRDEVVLGELEEGDGIHRLL